jgi:hypothetical protein
MWSGKTGRLSVQARRGAHQVDAVAARAEAEGPQAGGGGASWASGLIWLTTSTLSLPLSDKGLLSLGGGAAAGGWQRVLDIGLCYPGLGQGGLGRRGSLMWDASGW